MPISPAPARCWSTPCCPTGPNAWVTNGHSAGTPPWAKPWASPSAGPTEHGARSGPGRGPSRRVARAQPLGRGAGGRGPSGLRRAGAVGYRAAPGARLLRRHRRDQRLCHGHRHRLGYGLRADGAGPCPHRHPARARRRGAARRLRPLRRAGAGGHRQPRGDQGLARGRTLARQCLARQHAAGDAPRACANSMVRGLGLVCADGVAYVPRRSPAGGARPVRRGGPRHRRDGRSGDPAMIAYATFGLMGLLSLSIPVGIVLFLLGFGLDIFFTPFPLMRGLGNLVWSTSNNPTLIAIPFFVLLGEILVRSGIATRTYAALDRWVSWLPGGLVHANVATATMFSATSGSSVATAATVATVAMPQAEKLGYDPKLFSGAIAAGGTLGIMIPPSINLIVYGFLTQTSIPQLFLAGLVPGIALALAFLVVTAIICALRPELGGERRTFPLAQMLRALLDLLPILALFAIIIGTIYKGWATPTEAAAVGVAGALAIAAAVGGLSARMLSESLLGTVRITSMIMLVVIGASFLNFTLASAGLGSELRTFLEGLGLTPLSFILVIVAIYVVLGFFIETLSLMVVTIPIIVPLVVEMGYDPIWFGILMIVLIEMALITPPVGLNLYVVQGARQSGTMSEVMLGAIPYVIAMLLMAVALIAFPQIALYLPGALQ